MKSSCALALHRKNHLEAFDSRRGHHSALRRSIQSISISAPDIRLTTYITTGNPHGMGMAEEICLCRSAKTIFARHDSHELPRGSLEMLSSPRGNEKYDVRLSSQSVDETRDLPDSSASRESWSVVETSNRNTRASCNILISYNSSHYSVRGSSVGAKTQGRGCNFLFPMLVVMRDWVIGRLDNLVDDS